MPGPNKTATPPERHDDDEPVFDVTEKPEPMSPRERRFSEWMKQHVPVDDSTVQEEE